MIPRLVQMVSFIEELAHPDGDPAGDRDRQPPPHLALLNGLERSAPVATRSLEVSLAQLEVGQRAINMDRANARARLMGNVQRLEKRSSRLVPAGVTAVGL